MVSKSLDKFVREVINELVDDLEEVSTSAGAGHYNTPFAFRGNQKSSKEKTKKNMTQAGYTAVDNNLEPADPVGDDEERVVKFGEADESSLVKEARYRRLKSEAGTPVQKIGLAISEIAAQIKEVDRQLSTVSQLKNEYSVNSTDMWKRTQRNLVKLEGRLNNVLTKIRNLKS